MLVEEGWHATMVLARALEHAGHAVTVLTANGTTASCRRGTQHWRSGPAIEDPQLAPQLDQLVTAGAFDRVLPLTEAAMALLWDLDPPWADRVFPSVDAWQRRLLGNKHTLIEHMAGHGIAVPEQHRLGATHTMPLPCVIKGAIGSGGRRVRIVETAAALDEAVERARTLGGDWVAQELVPGPTYLVGGVFHAGRALRIYPAEKLEQHPPRIGGAIHLRSIADPALLAIALATFETLRWTGFASADFMRRADGSYVLLEVNPRMWGSLAGAASADVDLFAPIVELIEGRTPQADLGFTRGAECMIFPRYLNAASHRTLAGVRQAIRDLRGDQGQDWLAPRFVLHTLHRLYWMKRQSERF